MRLALGGAALSALALAVLTLSCIDDRGGGGGSPPVEQAEPVAWPAVATEPAREPQRPRPAVGDVAAARLSTPAAAARETMSAAPPVATARAATPQATVAVPVTGSLPTAEPVRATVEPRSIQLLTVPVPDSLSADGGIAYAIVPTGGATIIGPLTGSIEPGPAVQHAVTIVASVPAGAAAGDRPVAQVQFFQGGVPRVQVPVVVEVLTVQGAALRLAQPLYGARSGDEIAIRYFLTNQGNSRDTLDLTAVAPAGWSVDGVPARHVLDAGETATGELRVTVPRLSATGALRVRLVASSPRGELARVDALIEVLEATAVGRAAGPRLVAGVASVLTDSSASNPVVGLELSGPLTERIQVSGRFVEPLDPDHVDFRGLSRVGYFPGAPYLTLSGQDWYFTGGTTGRSFGDVAGLNLFGRGASFSYSGRRWSVAALAARPLAAAGGGPIGRLLGAQVGAGAGQGRVTGTVTDLEDPQFGGRRLRAFGLGGLTPSFRGMTVSGELAYREHAAAQGIGWTAEARRQGARDQAQLRVVSAPGGSAAFARARRELSAVGSRQFGRRILVGAGLWTTDDDNPVFSTLHTSGWSLAPRLALSDRMTIEFEARATSFDASGPVGAFGNGETVVRLGITTQAGGLYGSGSLTVGASSRSAAIPGGPSTEVSAGRQAARGMAGWVSDRGRLEASVAVERNGVGTGFFPRQYLIGARAERVAILQGSDSPLLNAEWQQYGWFGDRPDVTVVRAGVEVPLPGNLRLAVDVERNPFITGLGGTARWVPVMKLERVMRVPFGSLRSSAHGVVYQDLNANSRRDRGEPPVAGVVVRRGGETIVTEASGRFRFFERTDAPTRLDETSLPFGLVANPTAAPPSPGEKRLELGVIPTAAVEVRLVPTPDDDGRRPAADFDGVPVRAVDRAGQAWSGRADSAGVAWFHSLPPGEYQLELDFSGLREPVRLRGAAPTFRVVPGQETPPVVVPVYSRPVRLFDPSNPGRGRGPSR